jgi:membrane-bound serine protease (ClpP class)
MELVLILLVAGVVLVFAECVLPGMIAGFAGACCLLAGVVAGYLRFGSHVGTGLLLGVMIGLVGGGCLWVRFFPDSRFARSLISRRVVGDIGTERPELLNHTGTALSPLRPAGTVLIDGKRVDVVTEGGMIERGASVRVVGVEGMRIVVREYAHGT